MELPNPKCYRTKGNGVKGGEWEIEVPSWLGEEHVEALDHWKNRQEHVRSGGDVANGNVRNRDAIEKKMKRKWNPIDCTGLFIVQRPTENPSRIMDHPSGQ